MIVKKHVHHFVIYILVVLLGLPLFSNGKGFKHEDDHPGYYGESSAQHPDNGLAPAYNRLPGPESVSKGFTGDGLIANAWLTVSLGGDIDEGPVYLSLPDGAMTNLQIIYPDEIWMTAADYIEEEWYGVSFSDSDAGLYTIDPITGEFTSIGNTGYYLDGLTWDVDKQALYGVGVLDGISTFFEIDKNTANTEIVGAPLAGVHVIAIAAGNDGDLFGIGLDDNLYSFDPYLGQSTLIGPLGYPINFAQDLAYDRDNGVLYGTLYTTSDDGGLFEIDTQTGEASLLNNHISQVTGFAIPYSYAADEAPGLVEEFNVSPGEEGALEATLTWTNPSLNAGGDPLSDISEVVIQRNREEITSLTNMDVGQPAVYTDTALDEPGIYTYRIFAVNSHGEGMKTSETKFVGEDGPGPPENVLLTEQDGDAIISWQAPETGFNGGWFSEEGLSYNVFRMPGEVLIADDVTDTSIIDDDIPGMGNYYYIVAAYNNFSTGGFAASNTELLQAPERLLLYETFDDPIGDLPAGWSRQGVPHGWRVFDYDYAGGTPPELWLNQTPNYFGKSRVVRGPVNLQDHEAFVLTFKQFLLNINSAFDGEKVAIDVSWDGGEIWHTWWETAVEEHIPVTEMQLFKHIPHDVSHVKLGIRFEGENFNITRWALDDFELYAAWDDDLQARNISGNTTPTPGQEVSYNIDVVNVGINAQSDYTVKLMHEDGRELASVDGLPVDFGETRSHTLTWTLDENEDQGEAIIYGLVDLDGDQNPDNNQTPPYAINIQDPDILAITIGTDETFPPVRIPFDFHWKNSLSQSMYFAEEIGMDEMILSGVAYASNFVSTQTNKHIQIWAGETELDEMPFDWIDLEDLTLVFDGYVDFPEGSNEIFISFDLPYIYRGDNLVLYTHRVFENQFAEADNLFYGTLDINSKRTLRRSDDNPLNPENPGFVSPIDWFPNTKLIYLDASLGNLAGYITDDEGREVGDVEVQIMDTNYLTYSEEDGYYVFSEVLADTYDLHFFKEGHQSVTITGIEVPEEDTLFVDVVMPTTGNYAVTGIVQGNNGLNVPGALVQMEGDQTYEAFTENDGAFHIDEVAEGSYTLSVRADYYHFLQLEDVTISGGDLDLEVVEVEERIVSPAGMLVEQDNPWSDEALLSWKEPQVHEFRFDDGQVAGQLGVENATWNTVMGSAHRNVSVLNEISWFLTQMGGPHNAVQVWVFGLDEYGQPDASQLLYHNQNIPNTDEEWNEYRLEEPLKANHGFFVGLSYYGFLAIAHDTGTNPDWPFQQNTHFFIGDVESTSFVPIEESGFTNNLLIRANGIDYGFLHYDEENDRETENGDGKYLSGKQLTQNYQAGHPQWRGSNEQQSIILNYQVYLDGQMLADDVETTQYMMDNLSPGDYLAGLRAIYATGDSDISTRHFEVTEPAIFAVTFTVTDESLSHEDLVINGDMTSPPWTDIPMNEGPSGEWTAVIDVTPGTWQWGVKADDGSDDGQWLLPDGEMLEFTIDETGEIQGDVSYTIVETDVPLANLNEIRLFPNPASDYLHVTSDYQINLVELLDFKGRTVYSKRPGTNDHTIKVSHLNGGMYFMRLHTSQRVILKKVEII